MFQFRKLLIGVSLIAASVSACTTTPPTVMRWTNNNNATYDQWMKDRYACYNETQQRVSGAYVGPYGGAASSTVIPSCSAFNACLAARGYFRSDATGTLTVPAGAVVQCQQQEQ